MKVKRVLTTIDTHTAGGPTRILTGGLPPLPGRSVREKMEHFQAHHDAVRKLLMHEPRGHRDMSGAVLTEATGPEADLGVFFLTSGGYLPACVHSSMGVAVAGLQTGFLPPPSRPDGTLRLEVPAGVVSLIPEVEEGGIRSVTLRTPPAFVHSPVVEMDLGHGPPIRGAVVFSGVFFLLVEVGELSGALAHEASPLAPENAQEVAELGVRLLEVANRTLRVAHPLDPTSGHLALVMICEVVGEGHGRDLVVGRTGAIDRSPCGAGTGARVVHLFTEGRLGLGEEYRNESFLGTSFLGRVVDAARVGPYPGGVPEIKGSAFITGMHQFVLDQQDPLPEGFIF